MSSAQRDADQLRATLNVASNQALSNGLSAPAHLSLNLATQHGLKPFASDGVKQPVRKTLA